MNNKTLILLATILLGLIAIAIVPKIFKQNKTAGEELKNVSVDLSGYTQETTTKVSLKKADKETILSVQDGEWQVNNEKADQAKISSFFTDLKEAKIKSLASKNDENQKKFQVTPEDGTILIISQNGEDQEFYIGKPGPSYGTFYIRKKGIKNVYLMESGLSEKLSWDGSQWKPEEEKTEGETTGDETTTPVQNMETE